MCVLHRPTTFSFTLPIRVYMESPVILGEMPILTPQLLINSVGLSFTEIPSSYPLNSNHYIFCLSLHLLQVSEQRTRSADWRCFPIVLYAPTAPRHIISSPKYYVFFYVTCFNFAAFNHAAHEHVLRKNYF
jgi:hypothetical protein